MTDALIAELRHEAGTTRRVLERVPDDRLSWSPHPKSMTLGQLAHHVAVLPAAITTLVSELTADVPDVPLPEAMSRDQLLTTLDESVATAAERLQDWGANGLRAEWRMMQGGETLLAMPRVAVIRSLLFNHLYHHRGQLTVYLRLLDVPVPSIYGPTADEVAFA